MDKPKFTPGPWVLTGKAKFQDLGTSALHPSLDGDVVGADGTGIIKRSAFGGVHGGSITEVQANANLIAAAPDLYAACDEIYTALTSPSRILLHSTRKEMQPVVALLRDALAKARGET